MNTHIKTLAAIVVIVAAIGGYGLYKNTSEAKVKVGIILPLSGDLASLAEPMKDAALMAIEDAGMGGKVQVLIEDDQGCDPKGVTNAAQKLISIDKVDVLYGPACSGAVLSVLPMTEQNKIVLMSPSATSRSLTGAGTYNFRTVSSDADKDIELVKYLTGKGFKKAAMLYDKSQDAFVQQKEDTKEAFINRGGQFVAEEAFVDSDKDVRSQLIQIKNSGADIVFFAATPKTLGLIMKQAKDLGMVQQFAATDASAGTQELIAAGGAATEGLVFPFAVAPDNKESKEFLNRYKEKYHRDESLFIAESYDAMMLLMKAIQKGGSSGDALKKNLHVVGVDYPGASGIITFTDKGDVVRPITIKAIQNGTFEEVK